MPCFSDVPPTCHSLEWAKLETIDLSLLHEVGGKESLASQLKRVLQKPGLQILLPDNDDEKWEWVKPKDNAIICNVGQAFEALSGGLFKATRYRVHVPPPDQAVYDRVGALLFTQPDIDYSLNPLAGSPLLQHGGRGNNYHEAFGKDNTMRKWVGGFRGSGNRECPE